MTRRLSQGYKVNRLSNTFKKFYGRHTDLVGKYRKEVCQMFADSAESADLKISKSASLSLNHHNFWNTKPIYTE